MPPCDGDLDVAWVAICLDCASSVRYTFPTGCALALSDQPGSKPSAELLSVMRSIVRRQDISRSLKQLGSLLDTCICVTPDQAVIIRGGASKIRLFFRWNCEVLTVSNRVTEVGGEYKLCHDFYPLLMANAILGPFESTASLRTVFNTISRVPPGGAVVVPRSGHGIYRVEALHDQFHGLPSTIEGLQEQARTSIDSVILNAVNSSNAKAAIHFEVSGGLDSTVVALRARAVLAERRDDYVWRGISLLYPYYEFRRERLFIDEAYAALGIPMIEIDGRETMPFIGWPEQVVGDEPNIAQMGRAQHRAVLGALSQGQYRLLFNGMGGDTIFGMGPEGQFVVPLFSDRPSWIDKSGWSLFKSHLETLRAYLGTGSELHYRQYFSGVNIDDSWADAYFAPSYQCVRVCAFTDAKLLSCVFKLWEKSPSHHLYKSLLRDLFKSELPVGIRTRTHKVAYDGLYVRGVRRARPALMELIRRGSAHLAQAGIHPRRFEMAVSDFSNGKLDETRLVAAVLCGLEWRAARGLSD